MPNILFDFCYFCVSKWKRKCSILDIFFFFYFFQFFFRESKIGHIKLSISEKWLSKVVQNTENTTQSKYFNLKKLKIM